jgi:hypothetical protein
MSQKEAEWFEEQGNKSCKKDEKMRVVVHN